MRKRITFLKRCLDADQRAAETLMFCCRDSREPWPPEQQPGRGGPALTAYLVRFTEHRALRDIATKRRIIEAYEDRTTDAPEIEWLIRSWAAAYPGEPGFDQAWAENLH